MMEEHTPEQDINLRNQAIIYAGYYTRARAEEAARRKRQVHIDALKKALGVAC